MSGFIGTLRRTAERYMEDTATIERKSTQNVGGEEVATWTILSEVRCRITPIGGGETGTEGGRIADETTHLVLLPAGQDVEEADRLFIEGTAYEATLVRKYGELEPCRRVEVKESVEV